MAEKGYIDSAAHSTKVLLGEELTSQNIVDIVTVLSPDQRAATIMSIDKDLDDPDLNLRKRANLMNLRRTLTGMHRTMTKVNR